VLNSAPFVFVADHAMIDDRLWQELGLTRDDIGIVLVDHGSRRDESNGLLVEVARALSRHVGVANTEPAHMEVAEPSVHTAFQRAVSKGARFVIVVPYFLGPGRHWKHDIPRLAAEAAAEQPGIRFVVTEPIGLHPLMCDILDDRIQNRLREEVPHPASGPG
jgi:sirohydrochlorin ferrochelatase